MAKLVNIVIAAGLLSISSLSYAIQVNVQSPSDGVYAVGFSVNGGRYGASGKSYSQGNMPAGAVYTFGMRIGGLVFGAKDISCASPVRLNQNSTAVLTFDGHSSCYTRIL